MRDVSRKSRCNHVGSRFKRLGILQDPDSQNRYYLLVCQSCGSTVSTDSLRAQKKVRQSHRMSLSLL